MRKRFIIVGMIVVSAYLCTIVVWLRPGEKTQSEDQDAVSTIPQNTATPPGQTEFTPKNPVPLEDSRLDRKADGSVHYLPAIKTSRELSNELSPIHSLELIQALLEHYRFAYKENPVGVENFEFTEQLMGKNPMRIVFIDTDSKALRGNELVDTWNTPYFFHPISAENMEIRSAGPDRQLWTKDDIHLGD